MVVACHSCQDLCLRVTQHLRQVVDPDIVGHFFLKQERCVIKVFFFDNILSLLLFYILYVYIFHLIHFFLLSLLFSCPHPIFFWDYFKPFHLKLIPIYYCNLKCCPIFFVAMHNQNISNIDQMQPNSLNFFSIISSHFHIMC